MNIIKSLASIEEPIFSDMEKGDYFLKLFDYLYEIIKLTGK